MKKKFYKKTCLLYNLATVLFIFNFFTKVHDLIITSFFQWVLYYYLDNFVAIFTAKKTMQIRMIIEKNVYI